MKRPILVLAEAIACDVPAVGDIPRLAIIGKISAAGRPAYCKPAYLALRHLVHILINHFCFITGNRFACAGCAVVSKPVGDENMQHFGCANTVQNRFSSFGEPHIIHRFWQRLTGRDGCPERGQIGAVFHRQ